MDNILQVLNYAANYRGNFMDSLKELDGQLHERRQYCVYVFMISKTDGLKIDWISEMISESIPVYFMPSGMFEGMVEIRKIVRRHQIGIIHTHFLNAKQFFVIKISALLSKKDIVVHFHNHAAPSNHLIKRFVRKILYRNCKMIGVSASVTDGLKHIYPYNRCYEVDNAIDFGRLDKFSNLFFIQNEKSFGAKKCLIFGFDYERKGVDLALEAVSQIVDSGENIVLLISLSTNEDFVKRKILERFGEIPSWVICLKARNDVATLYRNVDVFLSPSREEGFCYSVVEAAYCNCNVVASKIPAQEDLAVSDVFWFESENIGELRKSIMNALERTERKYDNEELKERYDLSSWAKKVITVYESV